MLRNFVSRICPIERHDQTDKITTMIPTVPETTRCDNSITNSDCNFIGMSCPLQSGQDRPHPIPESVFVTSAPPNKINSIPMVVNTDNHFKRATQNHSPT